MDRLGDREDQEEEEEEEIVAEEEEIVVVGTSGASPRRNVNVTRAEKRNEKFGGSRRRRQQAPARGYREELVAQPSSSSKEGASPGGRFRKKSSERETKFGFGRPQAAPGGAYADTLIQRRTTGASGLRKRSAKLRSARQQDEGGVSERVVQPSADTLFGLGSGANESYEQDAHLSLDDEFQNELEGSDIDLEERNRDPNIPLQAAIVEENGMTGLEREALHQEARQAVLNELGIAQAVEVVDPKKRRRWYQLGFVLFLLFIGAVLGALLGTGATALGGDGTRTVLVETTDAPTISAMPTTHPSYPPTRLPSTKPSSFPSMSGEPTMAPSHIPSISSLPSLLPSEAPTSLPSSLPTAMPDNRYCGMARDVQVPEVIHVEDFHTKPGVDAYMVDCHEVVVNGIGMAGFVKKPRWYRVPSEYRGPLWVDTCNNTDVYVFTKCDEFANSCQTGMKYHTFYRNRRKCRAASWFSTAGQDYYVMLTPYFVFIKSEANLQLPKEKFAMTRSDTDAAAEGATIAFHKNDRCDTAFQPLTAPWPQQSFYGSLEKVGATTGDNSSFTLPDCSSESSDSVHDDRPGVWYKIDGIDGVILAHTCSGSTISTEISVFEGGDCGSLACVTHNRDGKCPDDPSGMYSAVSWNARRDVVYRILVRSHGAVPAAGSISLSIESLRAANDKCTNAEPIDIDPTGKEYILSIPMMNLAPTLDPEVTFTVESARSSTRGLWYSVMGSAVVELEVTVEGANSKVFSLGEDCENLPALTGFDMFWSQGDAFWWRSEAGRKYLIYVFFTEIDAIANNVQLSLQARTDKEGLENRTVT